MTSIGQARTKTIMDGTPDILCEIFHACMLDCHGRPHRGINSILTPLHISHVCRLWRNTSLSFGALWSYLSLKKHDCDTAAMTRLFETWLERTNGYPLNFAFYWDFYVYHKTEGANLATSNIIATLLSEQQRWKAVEFHWIGLDRSPNKLELRMTDMPLLISLSLSVYSGTGYISIARSSRLREVALEGDFDVDAGTQAIYTLKRWLSFFPGSLRLPFLKVAPNLDRLRLNRSPASESVGEIDGEIESLTLQNLRILDTDGGFSPFIIDKLRFPALTTLRYYDRGAHQGAEPLLRFAQLSVPPLTHLELGVWVWDESLVPVLKLLPALEALGMRETDRPMWLVQCLTIRDAGTESSAHCHSDTGIEIICPHLTSLVFKSADGPYHHFLAAFSTMLDSRQKRFQTFSSVIIKRSSQQSYTFLRIPMTIQMRDRFSGRNLVWATGDHKKLCPFNELYQS